MMMKNIFIRFIEFIILVLNKLARRFVESSRFRNSCLTILVVILCGIGLAVSINPLQRGLIGTYYSTPDWSGSPLLTINEQNFNLWRMRSQFPGTNTNYSIQWTGIIFVPVAGKYQFNTLSDDGSELWLDKHLIVDNRGLHGMQERTGTIHLEKGFYPMTIRYMQWGGIAVFRAYWTPPGKSREDLSQAMLFTQQPTAKSFLIHRILGIFLVVCSYFCLLCVGFILLIWLNSRAIFRPFLRNSFLGRTYEKFRASIVRRDVVLKAYPTAPKNNVIVYLSALLGYTVLSLLWTYPLIANFSNKVIGLGGDRYIYLWNMWWMKKALFELHTNPLYTDYIFYPQGTGLGFHDFSMLNALLSVPLQGFFSLQEIYNILFLLTFILGGFGCFLLLRYLTGDNLAAFFSGLVFVFWGARAYNVDHLSLASIQWFPFSALYLIKTLRESSYRNPVLAAIFLMFNALSSHYYAVYMVMFVSLFLLYYAFFEGKTFFTTRCLKRFVLIGVLSTLIMLPIVFPMLSEVFGGQDYMNYQVLVAESASPNLLLFPGANHAILGKYVRYLYARIAEPVQWGLTGGSFIGYTVIVLSLYTVLKLRHVNKKFWILTGLVFLILACGPYPRIFSKFYTHIPLPYQLLLHVPILKGLRVPIRFLMVVMLCCSVLSGYACWDLFRRIRLKKTFFVLLSIVLLFEFFRVYYVSPIEKTPTFYQELGQDTEQYAILELTRLMTWEHSSLRSSLFQTTHNKKLFHGHASRLSLDAHYQAYALYTTFDDFFTQPREFIENPSLLETTRKKILGLLSYYNVHYVALYQDYWHGRYPRNFKRLKKLFGKPVAEHPEISWFKVDKTPLTESIIFPGFGLFPLEYDDDMTIRQTARQADFKVLNMNQYDQMHIRFEGKSYHLPEEQVEISVNNNIITTVTVKDWTDVDIPAVPLKPGENSIRFRTTNEDRKYGIRIRNFEVKLLKKEDIK